MNVAPSASNDRPRASRSRESKKASLLGEGFAIGVATAGFQIEGGYNGDGEPANNWYSWERSGRVERSAVACDFWAHPEEALDRAAAIGCTVFRLSVEWARLEPEAGRFDEAALDRYVEILELCASRGLDPMITLHHFTHPAFLGEEFWLRPGSPDRFARHVARVLPALAPHCRRWVTINEPNIVMLKGWIEGAHPPGRRAAFADAFCVLDNLLAAHVLAADAIVAVQPGALVTCNPGASSIYELDRLLTDLLQLRAAGIPASDADLYVDERRALHDAALPPQHAGEFALRRFFAALSPYGTNRGAGGGPLWSRLRAAARRPAPRRVLDVVEASPHTAQSRRHRLRLVRPRGQSRPRPPGAPRRVGRAGVVPRTRPVGRGAARGRAARVVPDRSGAALRPSAVGGGERHGHQVGGRVPRPTSRRVGPPALSQGAFRGAGRRHGGGSAG